VTWLDGEPQTRYTYSFGGNSEYRDIDDTSAFEAVVSSRLDLVEDYDHVKRLCTLVNTHSILELNLNNCHFNFLSVAVVATSIHWSATSLTALWLSGNPLGFGAAKLEKAKLGKKLFSDYHSPDSKYFAIDRVDVHANKSVKNDYCCKRKAIRELSSSPEQQPELVVLRHEQVVKLHLRAQLGTNNKEWVSVVTDEGHVKMWPNVSDIFDKAVLAAAHEEPIVMRSREGGSAARWDPLRACAMVLLIIILQFFFARDTQGPPRGN
jgi:hypothetical protein